MSHPSSLMGSTGSTWCGRCGRSPVAGWDNRWGWVCEACHHDRARLTTEAEAMRLAMVADEVAEHEAMLAAAEA